jgi:hypothetical protein
LQKNSLAQQSDLYIFSDAAKTASEASAVDEVRSYLRTIDRHTFKTICIEEAELNIGLANSIIQGVSKVFEKHHSLIVLEDDLISSSNFLSFMNDSLQKFDSQKKVFSISGFSFDLGLSQSSSDSYFLNRGCSWGWATWKDRWEKVDWQIVDYNIFANNRLQRRAFSKGGSDLNAMLKKQMSGKIDSWAIRWFYNQYKMKGLTLYPVSSKIINIGFGKNATHTTGSAKRYAPLFDFEAKSHFKYPVILEISEIAQKKFQRKMGYLARIKSKIEKILKL